MKKDGINTPLLINVVALNETGADSTCAYRTERALLVTISTRFIWGNVVPTVMGHTTERPIYRMIRYVYVL